MNKMIERLWWILLLLWGFTACKQSAPVVLPTPTPAATPTCYVIVDVTSAAVYPVAFEPAPAGNVYYVGQEVETAVTGGITKWYELEICGDHQSYVA